MKIANIIKLTALCLGLALFSFLLLFIFTGGKNEPMAVVTPTPSAELMSTPTPTPTATATPEPTPTPSPTPEPTPSLPDLDMDSWELMLVNMDSPMGEYEPSLVEVEYGHMFDERAAEHLENFMQAARDEGLSVYLSSTYRDYATQKYLYEVKLTQYPEDIAKTIVAPPGTSEHQSGLAADITDMYYEFKNESLADTELYKWMSTNCTDYGFVVRFPEDKTEITGIMFEPWHFRYVGVEAAKYMEENNLCLEELHELYAAQP